MSRDNPVGKKGYCSLAIEYTSNHAINWSMYMGLIVRRCTNEATNTNMGSFPRKVT